MSPCGSIPTPITPRLRASHSLGNETPPQEKSITAIARPRITMKRTSLGSHLLAGIALLLLLLWRASYAEAQEGAASVREEHFGKTLPEDLPSVNFERSPYESTENSSRDQGWQPRDVIGDEGGRNESTACDQEYERALQQQAALRINCPVTWTKQLKEQCPEGSTLLMQERFRLMHAILGSECLGPFFCRCQPAKCVHLDKGADKVRRIHSLPDPVTQLVHCMFMKCTLPYVGTNHGSGKKLVSRKVL